MVEVPPAQLGVISVGISMTTWGARHHGNTAVADDSCAGPPPRHSDSSSETSRKYTVVECWPTPSS